MERKEISEFVRGHLCEWLCKNPEEIAGDSKLEDLGADDIDLMEISITLEDEFEIAIADETEQTWRTVDDVVDTVQAALVGR